MRSFCICCICSRTRSTGTRCAPARLRFRLAGGRAAPAGRPQPSHRVEKGAVTEAMVAAAARAGARLVLGRGAVLTPLARDRARAAGVEIEKER